VKRASFVISLGLSLALTAPADAAPDRVGWGDARLARWATTFVAGRASDTLAAVEADLRSSSPHPLAPLIWAQLEDYAGRLDAALDELPRDAALARAVGAVPAMYRLRLARPLLLARFPRDKIDVASRDAVLSWSAAANDGELNRERFDVVRAAFERRPDDFATVHELWFACLRLPTGRCAEELAAIAKVDAASPGGRWLAAVGTATEWIDVAEPLRAYVDAVSGDAAAWTTRGDAAYATGHYADALAHYQKAFDRYPFDVEALVAVAKVEVRLGKFDAARARVAAWAAAMPKDRRDARIAWLYGRALLADGERGRARAAFDDALARWPDYVDALDSLSSMDQSDSRPAQSLANAQRCVALDLRTTCAQRVVALLLADGRPDDALRKIAELDAKLGASTLFLWSKLDALARLGRKDERMTELVAATKAFPQSAWPRYELAEAQLDAKRVDDALAAFAKGAELDLGYWKRSSLLPKIDAAKGAPFVEAMLDRAIAQHPEIDAVWSDRESRISGKDTLPAKLALWARQRAAAKQRTNGWLSAIVNLVEKERWDEAMHLCDEWVAAAPTVGGHADALENRMWVYFRKKRAGKMTADEAKRALADGDAYLPIGSVATYYRYRVEPLTFLDRIDEAHEALVARARSNDLDWLDSTMAMFNYPRRDFDKFRGRQFELLARFLDRDPYSKSRYEHAIGMYGAYGGAPLLSLWMVARARAHGIDVDTTGWVSRSLRALGAYDLAFATGDAKKVSISPSDRYIMWWDDARREAQRAPSLIAFPFDPTTAGNCPLARAKKLVTPGSQTYAVICHPDGAVTIREVHPLTGKVMLVAEGAAWARVAYDATGWQAQRVDDSAGNHITFGYDARGHIVDADSTIHGKRTAMKLAYNDATLREGTILGVGTYSFVDDTFVDARGKKHDAYSKESGEVRREFGRAWGDIMHLLHAFEGNQDAVPELPFADKQLDKLRAAVTARPETRLALAEYELSHIEERRSYAYEAMQAVTSVLTTAQASGDIHTATRALALLDRLYGRIRAAGLSRPELAAWQAAIVWLADRGKTDAAARALVAKLAASPRKLVPQARWLPQSALENRGFWQRYADSTLRPAGAAGAAETLAVVVRGNGDVVIGTSNGLAVQHAGFWEWFSFDAQLGRWSADIAPSPPTPASRVRALAEDRDGNLWIGSDDGVMALRDYGGELRRWRSEADGIPTPIIGQLAATGAGVVVGTDKGARLVTANGPAVPIAGLETVPIVALDTSARPDAPLLAATPAGVFAIVGGATSKLSDLAARAVVYDDARGEVVALRGRELIAATWRPGATIGAWMPLPDAVDVVGSIVGLSRMTVDDGVGAIAITTDQGISFYRDDHVEHFLLPLADRHPGVALLASRDARTAIATTAGVYLYELGRATVVPGEVHDLLAAPDIGLTFVALGDRLGVVRKDRPRVVQTLDALRATRLARGLHGEIYVNNYTAIMRYTPSEPRPTYAFSAQPSTASCMGKYSSREPGDSLVRNILVAKDGSIWVAAGASVFHYRDADHVDEFNYDVDPARFPIRTDCVARVVETFDGKIWAIGSDEGFRSGNDGSSLGGGIVRWDGTKWERHDESDPAWFITGYTKLDDKTAIVSSLAGFARHTDAGLRSLSALKDASYVKLATDHPQLFLGTPGAQLGDGLWLFGAAGGVVAYRDGRWFYPERLNWMLPGIGFADRGGRAVHAIAVDGDGRIFVGTDLGLLVYDAGGRDAAAFLISQDQAPAAFAELAHKRLVEEADVLLPQLTNGSEAAARVASVRESKKQLLATAEKLATAGEHALKPADASATTPPRAGSVEEKLAAELDQQQRRHHDLLAKVEQEDPGLFQLLKLDPLDLAALARELGDDVAIVQYMPTREKLYVQVITRTAVELREVAVPRDELLLRARLASRRLASTGTVRGWVLQKASDAGQPPLLDELHWLYERLLRPIEPLVGNAKRVYIVPTDALTYLPFAALVRGRVPKLEFAVQRYAFGYLSSMYMLDLMLRRRASSADAAVIVADPDGSLPGARAEGKAVAEQFPKHALLVGGDATMPSLTTAAPKASILHLATHGMLDHDEPGKSFLLLANAKLTIADTMLLRLGGTDLVVLSACDSGIGKTGLEYATIARAFMHAGASTVLATLWEVDDEPTRELITRFYRAYARGNRRDAIDALARAQREMLDGGNDALARPQSWAGFVPFGGAIR
jgi:CHAT domain-containing protein/tetratricopeptide (TPR) repeat protein/ligand-binding sensor domain-containing protein